MFFLLKPVEKVYFQTVEKPPDARTNVRFADTLRTAASLKGCRVCG
ncbi:MAG: hypothetical protein K2J80_07075 [Oscillospiraceae bacterium]|nr:hypothetical protein [Oscillospiraceae bacterium]